jgi:hypothetical protein
LVTNLQVELAIFLTQFDRWLGDKLALGGQPVRQRVSPDRPASSKQIERAKADGL